jgi:hypothetical protein
MGPDEEIFSAVFSRAVILPDVYSIGILFRQRVNDVAYFAITDKVLVYATGMLQLESGYLISKPKTSKVKSLIRAVNTHLKDIFSSRSQNN